MNILILHHTKPVAVGKVENRSLPRFINYYLLHLAPYFDNTINMETKKITGALGVLAQESRLAIFRLLVETGPAALPVGTIAEKLGFANATLSFHLKELTHAGLTNATPSGRNVWPPRRWAPRCC